MALVLTMGIAILAACSGRGGTEVSTDDAENSSAASREQGDSAGAEGPGLINANASGAAGAIWVTGGLTVDSEAATTYTANTKAVAYNPDGTAIAQLDLDLPQDSFLLISRVVGGEDDILVGNLCGNIPQGEEIICSSEITPVLYRLADNRAERLPTDLTPPEATAAAGVVYPVGNRDQQLYLSQSDGQGPYPGTSNVRLLEVDLRTGNTQEVPLPDGVVTPQSVCSMSSVIAAAVPEIRNGAVKSIAILVEQSGDVETTGWRQVAVAQTSIGAASSGFLHCVEDGLVLGITNGAQTELFHITQAGATGWTASEPSTVGRSISTRMDGGTLLAELETGQGSPNYYEYRAGRLKPLEPARSSSAVGRVLHLVSLEGRAYEAGPLATTRPEQAGEAPSSVALTERE